MLDQPSQRSLSRRFLPKGLRERLQFERHPVRQFVLSRAVPLLAPGKLVLDAGSGSLAEQETRDQLRAPGARVHACDIARRNGLDFRADLHRTPVKDATYDVVICTQVLEHVRHPAVVCQELARILKPGGHLILTAPQSQQLHDLPHHYFNFTCHGLRLLLEEAGLRVEVIEPQGGHFIQLGQQLHYTCNVVRNAGQTDLQRKLLWPVEMLCRLLFGFCTKVLCLWLDRFDRQRHNVQGWCVLCVKPAAPAAPSA